MSSRRKSAAVVLVIAMVVALAAPNVAPGTVSVSAEPLATPAEEYCGDAIISGSNVAFDSVLRWEDPFVQVEPKTDVWNILTGQSIWTPSGNRNDQIEDLKGDWVAYRMGMMGDSIYVYNLATHQQWTISDTPFYMSVHSVRISGNKAVWLDGDPPSSILKTIDLTTGEVGIEGLLPSIDIAFEGDKVVYSRAFMADTNLWVYDLDTNETSSFVMEEGPQVRPDIRNGLVVWLDARNDWAIYSKPIDGGEQTLIANDEVSELTDPSVGDKFVTWTNILSLEQGQDVWARDLATGVNFPVATATGDQRHPSTDGSRIAYTDAGVSPSKIMIADVVVTAPKIAKFSAPKSLRLGAEGKFAVTVTNPDVADALAVKYDWGDGSTDTSQLTGGGKLKMSHAYQSAGVQTVTVTVTDASGIHVSRTAEVTVK